MWHSMKWKLINVDGAYLSASGLFVEAVRPDECALGLEALLQERIDSKAAICGC